MEKQNQMAVKNQKHIQTNETKKKKENKEPYTYALTHTCMIYLLTGNAETKWENKK